MNTLNYLAANDAANMTFESTGEALSYALGNSVFGFAVVFAVLILIWGVLSLLKVFFYTIPNAKKNRASGIVNKKVDSSNVQTSAAVVAVREDAAVIAAITAAISAFRSSVGESSLGFRVVSFKKRK